jgi:hypothetical protein
MYCKPLYHSLTTPWPNLIRLIATDMDGTLTLEGKFTAKLLQALEDLADAKIPVLIVTGRSAGWVSGLVSYLPVVGAIAENGGLFYSNSSEQSGALLTSIADQVWHRQKLAQVFQQLQTKFPQIQESADNRFRITDWTFDNQGFSPAEVQQMAALCQVQGWGFTYSAVQCHIKLINQSKRNSLLQVLKSSSILPYRTEQVLTVGDSPNDESLFDPQIFPYSIGVANVLRYLSQMEYQPAYVTAASEGLGFCEVVRLLLQARALG